MKNTIIIFLFTLSAFLLFSCNNSNSNIIGNPDGVFQGKIVLIDTLGTNQGNGTIKLTQTNNTDINGTWSFQNGESGELVGSINNMQVELNLNPENADNNTILIGIFDGQSINGKWYYSSFIGLDYRGTFIATAY